MAGKTIERTNLYHMHMGWLPHVPPLRCIHNRTLESGFGDGCSQCRKDDPEAYQKFTEAAALRRQEAPINLCDVKPGPLHVVPSDRKQITIQSSPTEVAIALLTVVLLALTLGYIQADARVGSRMREALGRCEAEGAHCIYVVLPETPTVRGNAP